MTHSYLSKTEVVPTGANTVVVPFDINSVVAMVLANLVARPVTFQLQPATLKPGLYAVLVLVRRVPIPTHAENARLVM